MPLKKNCDCLDSFEIIAQLSKTTVNGRLERPCHTEAGLNRGLSARGRNGGPLYHVFCWTPDSGLD